MKEKRTIVMLPTSEASLLVLLNGKKLLYNESKKQSITSLQGQYLYILSTEPIQGGDWIIRGQELAQANDEWIHDVHEDWKKVIATTNPALYKHHKTIYSLPPEMKFIREEKGPAEIPQSLIEVYIKAYNEGKPMSEVDIQYHLSTLSNNKKVIALTLNPDNTIIWSAKEEEKKYTKQDMENCWNMSNECATGTDDFPMGGNTFKYPDFDTWIKTYYPS